MHVSIPEQLLELPLGLRMTFFKKKKNSDVNVVKCLFLTCILKKGVVENSATRYNVKKLFPLSVILLWTEFHPLAN